LAPAASTELIVPPPPAAPAAASVDAKTAAVRLCPMTVVNAPDADQDGVVARAGTRVAVDGLSLRLAPANDVCLSSGFGLRNGRLHRGVDYYALGDSVAVAAASGIVRKAMRRDDLGNIVVIDHGGGVFTMYGHLERFADGVRAGETIGDGAPVGPLGATGRTDVRHLHFEIRRGEWREPAGVFGLEAQDPFSLPRVAAES
ncbi:MAG: M23 family metallopeptidase, partial [Parvularculaceae bacterium]|nr:M23 family metallopeptidase [Parvularculaceae bacterium]